MVDVIMSVFFGFLGYALKKAGFNLIPLLLGFVLGEMVEQNFHRALQVSGGPYSIFWASPISKLLILFTLLSLIGPHLSPLFKGGYRRLITRNS